jgi:hypothetical protein
MHDAQNLFDVHRAYEWNVEKLDSLNAYYYRIEHGNDTRKELPFKNENMVEKQIIFSYQNVKTYVDKNYKPNRRKSIRLSWEVRWWFEFFYAVLKYQKYLKQECFRLLWFSKDIYYLMEQSKKRQK